MIMITLSRTLSHSLAHSHTTQAWIPGARNRYHRFVVYIIKRKTESYDDERQGSTTLLIRGVHLSQYSAWLIISPRN